MIFGVGPVMRYEMITTARRGRYYLARVVYGLLLLLLLWREFESWEGRFPAGGNIEEVNRFAESTFIQFAGLQGLMLLVMIPALVAGVIADEHQRKTLHYLLASRLSSMEIVLGKLGARLLSVATFVALGLPVVALLGLYGGLNPEYIFHVYLGTFTTILFVAGLSILISTLSNRPRDAILVAYVLEAIWLVGPIWIRPYADALTGPLFWVETVSSWVLATNPYYVWQELTNRASGYFMFPNARLVRPGWAFLGFHWISFLMAGLQAAFGLFFLVVTIIGLRPLRGSSWPASQPRKGWLARLRERLADWEKYRTAAAVTRNELLATRTKRPACGDKPMHWKERYTSMGGGLSWLGGRPMMLFFGVLLGCFLLDMIAPVISDLALGRAGSRSLDEMNGSIRFASVVLVVVGMVTMASAAAVSVTGEREQDTWISLATTLLTPEEVVRAKVAGAFWSARRIGVALLILWVCGVALGAIHPVGVLIAAAIIGVAGWFIATAGVFISTFARNSTRALTFMFLILFVLILAMPPLIWLSLFAGAVNASGGNETVYLANTARWEWGIFQYTAIIAAAQVAAALVFTYCAIGCLRATWGKS